MNWGGSYYYHVSIIFPFFGLKLKPNLQLPVLQIFQKSLRGPILRQHCIGLLTIAVYLPFPKIHQSGTSTLVALIVATPRALFFFKINVPLIGDIKSRRMRRA